VDATATIISRWLAAERAITESSKDPGGPQHALLVDYLVDPQLSYLRNQLAADARDGLVDIGEFDPGQPRVETASASQAVVVSCATNRLQLIFKATGKPLPGKAGDPTPALNGIRSTMVLTPSGVWKMSQSTVEDGSCAGL
jgi:hypothetical protein